MAQNKVLLVEDIPAMHMIVRSLIGQSCALTWAENLKQAHEALQQEQFQLCLLDVILPDGNGFEFCEMIRKQERFSTLPIIFLTSQSEVEDRVRGFSLGADDYVVKPFEPNEFVARVNAKLKRIAANKPQTSLFHRNFQIDLKTMRASSITSDGAKIALDLTPIEFKMLAHFINLEGKIVTREDLVIAAWGDSVHVSAHTVDTHISSLRKKLRCTFFELKAVVKQGYCFQSTAPAAGKKPA